MATLEDLEAARAELAAWEKRWEDYSGNNPDKYRSDIRSAQAKVSAIEAELKASGVLVPKTPEEQLHADLDAMFPNAKSREVVEFEGKRYRRRFIPMQRSNSGKTVKEWGKTWEELT